jgi:tRNA pseudouridine38-40 synthase
LDEHIGGPLAGCEYHCAALVEYDGTEFYGFQVQASGRTVQGELEKAIEKVSQQKCRVIGSGRTDAGVHASGQVIRFAVHWEHPLGDLFRALNAVLPADIAINNLKAIDADFHPRFSAASREYRYTIYNQPGRSPLKSRFAWHVPEKLDVAALGEAGGYLLGEHDFCAFGKPPAGEVTQRRVMRLEWQSRPPFLTMDIEANAFLYHMVRNIVGTLARAGRGEIRPEEVKTILTRGERKLAGPPAPPWGLCLTRVNYQEELFMADEEIR